MSTQHTSGPWYSDKNGGIWRRNPSDLYENGGGVAGDRQLATVWKGWVNEGEIGYPLEANARLIAAAPDLLAALKQCRSAIKGGQEVAPYDSRGAGYEQTFGIAFVEYLDAAIAKATGEQK